MSSGAPNYAYRPYTSIIGGAQNRAGGFCSSISGGPSNSTAWAELDPSDEVSSICQQLVSGGSRGTTPAPVSLFSQSPTLAWWVWRKRVGIEPTAPGVSPEPDGFEGRAGHQTRIASSADH